MKGQNGFTSQVLLHRSYLQKNKPETGYVIQGYSYNTSQGKMLSKAGQEWLSYLKATVPEAVTGFSAGMFFSLLILAAGLALQL